MSESNTDEEITNTDDELLVSLGRSGFSGRRYAWSYLVKLSFLERCSTQYRMENSKKSINKSLRKT